MSRFVSGWFAGMLLGSLCWFTPPGWAQESKSGLYVGAHVGGVFRPDTRMTSPTLGSETVEFQPGYTFGGVFGYDFGQWIRIEGEIAYRENTLRTGSGDDPQAGTSVMMFNAFYDFYLFDNKFDVYFGGGLGAATAQLETFSLGRWMDENETVFAYQLEAGVGYNVTRLATFTVGYRYFDSDDPEFELSDGSLVTMGLSSHEILLKMRFRFPL